MVGLVLRRRDVGESDRRLTLITAEEGRLDVVAKGARKIGSRLLAVSEPLSMADFAFAAGRVNRFLTHAQPMRAFPELRQDYERLSMGLALAELYANLVPEGRPSPEEFETLQQSLRLLCAHQKPLAALIWCELKLLEIEGQALMWDRCVFTGEPLNQPFGWVFPSAGGLVAQPIEHRVAGGFRAAREVLIGLARTAELDAPPAGLRRAHEAFHALTDLWQGMLHQVMPAHRAVLDATAGE